MQEFIKTPLTEDQGYKSFYLGQGKALLMLEEVDEADCLYVLDLKTKAFSKIDIPFKAELLNYNIVNLENGSVLYFDEDDNGKPICVLWDVVNSKNQMIDFDTKAISSISNVAYFKNGSSMDLLLRHESSGADAGFSYEIFSYAFARFNIDKGAFEFVKSLDFQQKVDTKSIPDSSFVSLNNNEILSGGLMCSALKLDHTKDTYQFTKKVGPSQEEWQILSPDVHYAVENKGSDDKTTVKLYQLDPKTLEEKEVKSFDTNLSCLNYHQHGNDVILLVRENSKLNVYRWDKSGKPAIIDSLKQDLGYFSSFISNGYLYLTCGVDAAYAYNQVIYQLELS